LRPTLLQPDTSRSLIGVEVDTDRLAWIPEIKSERHQHDYQREWRSKTPDGGHAPTVQQYR
jgi:hypothetical protein